MSRTDADGQKSGWLVSRRYSQFLALHQQLKIKFPGIAQTVELPGKVIPVMMKIRNQLLENRRAMLEKYLIDLSKREDVCRSVEFRRFICFMLLTLGHQDIIRALYANEGAPVLESKKSFLKSIFTLGDGGHFSRRKSMISDDASPILKAGSSDFAFAVTDTSAPVASATNAITDLIVELFELKEKNNWLRRNAVVILLQQMFGDTVERRTTDALSWAAGCENALSMLVYIRETYWPSGLWSTLAWPVRTEELKNKTRQTVRGKVVGLAKQFGAVFGKQNSLSGLLRWFNVFQNRRLNQHLLYTILDELILLLFPECRPH